MSDLIHTVRQTIEHHNLLPRSGTVVVGVSGGPDSLCLLHVLRALAPEYDASLHVAHLNHQLRDSDSDQDAAFVEQLAREWNLPATIAARDVSAHAEREHIAIEEAARQMRYDFLAEVAHQVGNNTIAVAHHADDQAESVLMHIIRGSGLAGLRGMRPKSELGDLRLAVEIQKSDSDLRSPNSVLWLIRPLLYVTRTDIEAYCAEHDLHPRFDLSNLDQTYFRNWLRHTVLPLLAEHNPGVRDVLCRTAEVAVADYDLVHGEMERAWARVVRASDDAMVFSLADWRALPLALKRATVREAIHRLRRNLRNINFIHVERAVKMAERGSTGDRATLTEGLLLSVAYDSFIIADERLGLPALTAHAGPLLEPNTQVAVRTSGYTSLPGTDWSLQVQVADQTAAIHANPDPWVAYLDADACSEPLVLRTRQPGDRMAPHGMNGHHTKLSEMMINAKIPRRVRDRMPVLVCGERIVWACGLRIDEHARVTPATQRILRFRFVLLDE
jgi:tRNA(Ile)-lysidine synthetase-like protein